MGDARARISAVAGRSVTLRLKDNVDLVGGDVISSVDAPAQTADQFESTTVWMDDQPLLPGRPYQMKLGAQMHIRPARMLCS